AVARRRQVGGEYPPPAWASAERSACSDGRPTNRTPLSSTYNRQQASPRTDRPPTGSPSTRIVGEANERYGSGVLDDCTSSSSNVGGAPCEASTRSISSRAATALAQPGNVRSWILIAVLLARATEGAPHGMPARAPRPARAWGTNHHGTGCARAQDDS